MTWGHGITARSLAAALAFAAGAVAAQNNTLQEIERYRQMLQDGNPAELLVARGEDLWKEKRGPKKASLEQCDLGLGPGVVKGAYAQLPRYFQDTNSVLDFEGRLVHCMVALQGFDRVPAHVPVRRAQAADQLRHRRFRRAADASQRDRGEHAHFDFLISQRRRQ